MRTIQPAPRHAFIYEMPLGRTDGARQAQHAFVIDVTGEEVPPSKPEREVKDAGPATVLHIKPEKKRGANDLTEGEKEQLAELKARDREVRAHEQAHKSVGGALAGAIKYHTQRGPDGGTYAIGGEVPINVGEGRTPQETIQRAEQARAAALAPAQPSGADHAIAAKAAQMAARARAELAREPNPLEETDAAEETAYVDGKPRAAETGEPDKVDVAFSADRGHGHSDDGCGYCGRAVSAYGRAAAAA